VRARRTAPCFALLIGVAVAFTCITAAREASANGRFPKAQAIATVPGSAGETIFVRTTFGILVSRDRGASFRWMCERALGYDGQWDPPIAVTRDGTLWVGLEAGLVSTRDGCAVESAPELAGETVRDLTIDPRGETLWVITGAPGKPTRVYRRRPAASAAAGARWERLPAAGLDGVNPMTIEVAPSKPSRLYASGQPYDTIRGRLYRSDDGGKTFTGLANDLPAQGPFFIAAVDDRDPDRVLVRHLHTTGSDVLVTADGGATFRITLSMASAMFGFATSPDGGTFWAGSGLPEHGILRSADRGDTWNRVATRGVLCLHAPASPTDDVLACENALALGASAVAVSPDRGATWRSLARFADVRGPVACGGGDASAALCGDAAWEEIRAFVQPRAGAADAADAADADAAAPRPRSTAGDDAGARTPSTPARACGCEMAGAPRAPLDRRGLIAGVLALGVWAIARSIRGSSRDQCWASADRPGRTLRRDAPKSPRRRGL
jgi:hypothetical protein